MKTTAKFFMLVLVISSFFLMMPQKTMAQGSISFQVFYDNLSPYGYWVDNSSYGYVWVPNVSHRFTPYGTNGYWVYTNVGWTWVSNYSWGWAPFHYGRWFYDPFYGWIWVPGYEWGPGWVVWRSSPGYYGWAPIAPGISINIAYSSGYQVPYNQWIFVENNNFGRTNISNYYVSPSRNTTIIRNSTVVNNIRHDKSTRVRFNGGPDRMDVQKATKKAISPVVLKDRNTPGQTMKSNQLQVYRPQVEKSRTAVAPSKVAKWKDTKSAQREVKVQPRKETQPVNQAASQQKRAVQSVKTQPIPERRSNTKPIDRQLQQERSAQQNRQERNVQQQKQQQSQERRNNQQAVERQLQQQRNNQQMRQERNMQQLPQQLPANTQTRQIQQLPQQRNNQQILPQQLPQGRNESNHRQQR